MSVSSFLEQFSSWAANHPGVVAAALVGSHVRGTATPSSDVDLVVLCEMPNDMLAGKWAQKFGEVGSCSVEHYGAVRSLRVRYRNGLEVEFGIASPSWANVPLDPGTRAVLEGGVQILHDPRHILAAAKRAAVP